MAGGYPNEASSFTAHGSIPNKGKTGHCRELRSKYDGGIGMATTNEPNHLGVSYFFIVMFERQSVWSVGDMTSSCLTNKIEGTTMEGGR